MRGILHKFTDQKKKLCFTVEIKDGFISHYNSLKKKKIQVQFNTSIYFRKGNNSY